MEGWCICSTESLDVQGDAPTRCCDSYDLAYRLASDELKSTPLSTGARVAVGLPRGPCFAIFPAQFRGKRLGTFQ